MSSDRGATDTGVPVYPRLPVPKRESEPRLPQKKTSVNKLMLGVVGGALVLGVVIGFAVRPAIAPDKRIGEYETKAADADKAAASQKKRADELDKDVEKEREAKKAVEAKLAEAEKAQTTLADKAADAEKIKKDAEAVLAKLKTATGGAGTVSTDGENVRLVLPATSLFKGNEDELTPAGMKVLDKVGLAIKELPSKLVAVHGHTDDSPPPQPPVVKAPPPPPLKKGQKAPPAAPPPVVKRVTNWEMSAERALAVVRYLQEKAKVEPGRLTAEAFGQYRPASRSNRAANRRVEIVLSPKPAAKK